MTIPARTPWAGLLWTGALLFVGLACGSGDPMPTESRAPMAAAPHRDGANQPPVVQVRIEPDQPSIDDRVRAAVTVRDADGDATSLTYRWSVDGDEAGQNEPELDLANARPGSSIRVRVTASDGFAESEPAIAQAWVIDRTPVVGGLAIAPPKSVYPGDSIVVTPTASDPDGDLVDFEFTWLVNDEPVRAEGRSFSTEGLSHGDRVRVRVVASDRRNDSRAVESEDVVVGSAHPEIVSSPPQMSDEGVFRYEVEASDPDGDRNLRYRLAEAPHGMKIDEVRGLVEWRPSEDQVGVHPVSIVVADSTRLETTQRFEVTVGAASSAPPASEAPQE